MRVITLNHISNNTYFFSIDHCQGIMPNGSVNRDEWVPVTSYLPMHVSPRLGLMDGIIDTLEKYIRVFHQDEEEITNPNPDYTPDYRRQQ